MSDQSNQQGSYGFEVVNPYQAASKPGDDNSPLSLMMRKDDMLRIIQEYLKDAGVPKDQLEFWGLNSKFLPITFLTKDDVEEFTILQENAELINIMSKPPQEYTFAMMQNFEQQKAFQKIQINRAIGISTGRNNERTLQNTQISQAIMSQTNTAPGGGGGIRGAFAKMFG
jgi:hypothetical protein